MGTNQSKETKEEIVIAQSGNSGGSTTSQQQEVTYVSLTEVVLLLVATVSFVALGYYCYLKIRRNLEKKIRQEIRRSQEII